MFSGAVEGIRTQLVRPSDPEAAAWVTVLDVNCYCQFPGEIARHQRRAVRERNLCPVRRREPYTTFTSARRRTKNCHGGVRTPGFTLPCG